LFLPQSPNTAYSPSTNAASPRPGGRGGGVAGAGAQRSRSPQVLPSTYSPISTVLPPRRDYCNSPPSTGYTTAYPTAASPYASASSMAATSSHCPTAAQDVQFRVPSYTSSTSSLSGGAPIVPAGAPPRAPNLGLGVGKRSFRRWQDDDYSAQQSWNTQEKDISSFVAVLMENFTPAQYERFEAYRRGALGKQSVRKVIQQTLNMQVSLPVAQIVAGFSKVFVGEIVEKVGAVGTRSPREAYRMYQQETGRVGAARPLKSKKLFVK
ncbi:TAFII28-domain-containing protein, partial [Mycena olivaceomarginata]